MEHEYWEKVLVNIMEFDQFRTLILPNVCPFLLTSFIGLESLNFLTFSTKCCECKFSAESHENPETVLEKSRKVHRKNLVLRLADSGWVTSTNAVSVSLISLFPV